MTNQEIEQRLKSLVAEERRITHEILQLINLAEARGLHLERGYSSLFDWLVHGFGYSQSAAYRRIQAARLLKVVPAMEERLQTGELNLTVLAQTQSAIQAEEKRSRSSLSNEKKVELVNAVAFKSTSQAAQVLAAHFPESQALVQESTRVISPEASKVLLVLSSEDLEKLARVREILSHLPASDSLSRTFSYLIEDFLKRKEPTRELRSKPRNKIETPLKKSTDPKFEDKLKPTSAAVQHRGKSLSCGTKDSRRLEVSSGTETSGRVEASDRTENSQGTEKFHRIRDLSQPARRQVSRTTYRSVLQRDDGRCQFRDPETGKTCGSRNRVQIDHVHPKALGGSDEPENLRCLCQAHNLHRARKTFSRNGVSRPIPSQSEPT